MILQRRVFTRGSFLSQVGAGLAVVTAKSALASRLLHEDLTTTAVWRGDSSYDEARKDQNARLDFRPAVIAYCLTRSDVISSIRWAVRNDKRISIRSGGHDYEGFSLNDGGIVIDVSRYSGLIFGPGKTTAVIRAGTNLGTTYRELAKVGAALPAGSSASVAIAGLTTGGGHGLLARRYGLMCDKLRRVTLIDAEGRLRNSATDRQGDEILWACRGGGGGSFGVVTDFEFDLVSVPDKVTYFSALWRWDDELAAGLLARWFNWSQAAPRELTSTFTFAGGSPKTIRCAGLFLGEASKFKPLFDGLQSKTPPRHASVESLSYSEAIEKIVGRKSAPQSWKMKSSFIDRPLNDAAIETAVRQMADMPAAVTCLLAFDSYDGAIGDVASSATAFPHRSMRYLLQYQTYWSQTSAQAPALKWVREAFAAIDPYTARKSYRNYSDLDLADWQQRYFAGNYPQLQIVKALVDPSNRFKFAQSIELTGRGAAVSGRKPF